MSKLQKLAPQELSPATVTAPAAATPATWDQVRYWANIATKFQQASLAAQVMAGFELAELKKEHGFQRGGDRRSNPHDADLKNITAPNTWAELVTENCGISEDTAGRWIQMADGIRARWKKLAPEARIKELMAAPISHWSDADTKLVGEALHKATDGATQLEFMRELGLAKQKPGNPDAGAHGKGSRKLTTEEQVIKGKQIALEDSGVMGRSIAASNRNFFICGDNEVDIQISILEFALKIRRKWQNTPAAKRNDALVSEIEELVRKEASSALI